MWSTGCNSYAGGRLAIHVGKPELMARITVDKQVGGAPLEVHFSARESLGRSSRVKYEWGIQAAGSRADACSTIAASRTGKCVACSSA